MAQSRRRRGGDLARLHTESGYIHSKEAPLIGAGTVAALTVTDEQQVLPDLIKISSKFSI